MSHDFYCDGGVYGPNPSPIGGAWAFLERRNGVTTNEQSGPLRPGVAGNPSTITNNLAELYAAVMALEAAPDGWEGTLWTDSEVTIHRVRRGSKAAFKGVPKYLCEALTRVKARLGDYTVSFVRGHSGNPFNEWCDEMCNRAMQCFAVEEKITPSLDAELTQRIARDPEPSVARYLCEF